MSEGKDGGFKESKIECSRVNNATRPGIGVSAEILGRVIYTRKASSARRAREKDGKKERKKEGDGREEEEGKETAEEGQRSVPGACTIASPWRSNGFWMSHRVQSQTAISRRGISQGNDRASPSSRPSIYG